MIKVVNIVVLVFIVGMLVVSAIDKMRSAVSSSAGSSARVVSAEEPRSELAPDLCVPYAPPYMFVDEISGRRGLFLEQLLSIFPKARLQTRASVVSVDWALEQLKTNSRAALMYWCFQDPDAPTNFMRCARLPLGEVPIVLLTLRKQQAVEPEDLAAHPEYKIGIFEELLGAAFARPFLEAGRVKVYRGDFDLVEKALLEGEVVAFASMYQREVDKETYDPGYEMEKFRVSQPFAFEKFGLIVSTLDPAFADALIRDYEAGMHRLERTGERRRIYDYYGLPIVPLEPSAGHDQARCHDHGQIR